MHLHEDGGILKKYEKDLKKRKEKEKENQKMTYHSCSRPESTKNVLNIQTLLCSNCDNNLS